jgi:hypothetical protein
MASALWSGMNTTRTRRSSGKVVAIAIRFEERTIGEHRAVNYGGGQYADDIVIYHSSNPNRAVWNDTDWGRAEAWMQARCVA